MRKYGVSYFEVREIIVCNDIDTLNIAEQYFIQYFESNKMVNGYNLAKGGRGGCPSEEIRQSMREGWRLRKE